MVDSAQKIILITGCSKGGIGFALCEEFASRGCIVYATSRRLESMEGFQSPNVRMRVLDVTNEDDIQRTVKGILEEMGRIDIVVNNAGGIAICPIAEATIDQIRQAFELNTFSALRVSNAVLPSRFEHKRGLIVNIGSIAGHLTSPWNVLYCAAKAALHSITEGLAMECKPFGVKVMLVAPGGVRSNIAKNQAETFDISPMSVYKRWEPKIVQRMHVSQGPGCMDTDEFARRVVAQVLKANPPPYMSLGYGSTYSYLCQWLPRQYILGWMYKALVGDN